MRDRLNGSLINLVVVACLVLIPYNFSEAALNLSVTPRDGGSSLRFGRVDLLSSIDKEVRIRITSSGGEQYQVYQRILEPFRNERGNSLDRSVLVATSYPGSNSFGSLYLNNVERLGFSDQLIYTSDQTGNSDTLTVVYRVNANEMTASGNFTGQVIYTVRPVGSGAEGQIILNVFLEDTGELKVETETSSGRNSIHLKSDRLENQEGYIKISLLENVGQEVEIYQEIFDYPRNEVNAGLDRELVHFMTMAENPGGLNYQSPTELERKKVLLYTSNDTEDTIDVYFKLNDAVLSEQKAGTYTGQIRYTIEGADIAETIDVNLVVEITPIFKLVVESPTGGLNFPQLLPEAPPQFQEIYLTVQTNLDKPYMITHNMSIPLANEEGAELDDEYFRMKGELVEGKAGKLEFQDFNTVPVGDIPVYYSDADGSSSKIRIIYRIKPYRGMSAGSYKTMILYSLGEI